MRGHTATHGQALGGSNRRGAKRGSTLVRCLLALTLTLVGCLDSPDPRLPLPGPDGGAAEIAADAPDGDSATYDPDLDCVHWRGECYPVCDSNNPCLGHCILADDEETYFCSPELP